MTHILTDDDIDLRVHAGVAISAVEAVLRERAAGTAHLHPRFQLRAAGNALAYTPGALGQAGVGGLRVYPIRGSAPEQLVAVWDLRTGRIVVLVLGDKLGLLRTGAIGGVAAKLLSRPGAVRVAVIGAGRQALMQILAIRTLREIDQITLYRRDPGRRQQTATAWNRTFDLPVRSARTAREAVAGADIVVVATNTSRFAIDPDWLADDVYVASLGPKGKDHSELPLELLEGATRIVSDFPEQHSEDPTFLAYGTTVEARIEDLANVLAEQASPRPSGLNVFLSFGLAGTEVAVAAALADLHHSRS